MHEHDKAVDDATTKERGVTLQAKVRDVLLAHWDPLGINDRSEREHEYEFYVGPICDLLLQGATSQHLVTYLEEVERAHVGSQRHLSATNEEPLAHLRLLSLRLQLVVPGDALTAPLDHARAVVSAATAGDLGAIEMSRRLVELRHYLFSHAAHDEDFATVMKFERDTQTLPVGPMRRHWAPSALAKMDVEIAAVEGMAAASVKAAANAMLARIQADDARQPRHRQWWSRLRRSLRRTAPPRITDGPEQSRLCDSPASREMVLPIQQTNSATNQCEQDRHIEPKLYADHTP